MWHQFKGHQITKIPPPPKDIHNYAQGHYTTDYILSEYHSNFNLRPSLNYLCFCKNCGKLLHAQYEYVPPLLNPKRHKAGFIVERYTVFDSVTSNARYELFDDAQNAYEKTLKNGLKCPLCNAKIIYDDELFIVDERYDLLYSQIDHFDHYKPSFRKLEANYDAANRKEANALMVTYSKSCDVFFADAAPQKATEIKADNEMLRNYILHLIRLENNIYSLEQRLPELYYQRLLNDRTIVLSTCEIRNETLSSFKKEIEKNRNTYEAALTAVRAAERFNPIYEKGFRLPKPSEPQAPVLATPGLFNKKKVLAQNEVLTANYQAELKKYQEEMQIYETERTRHIAEERAKAVEKAQKAAEKAKADLDAANLLLNEKTITLKNPFVPAMAAKELLDKEITEAETLLQKSYAARNELYAYNVIFGKYRNIVALSSFYEYLMAGRCTSLEGADGAYNIFEGEIRADRIIAQLDAVNSSLDQIKKNQYMLYSEMSSVNSSLDSLNKTMDEALVSIKNMEVDTKKISKNSDIIAKNTAAIAYNTEVTAYYSKKTAELTNALGYMVAFK